MKNLFVLWLAGLLCLITPFPVEAAAQTVTAVGTYTIGDGPEENISVAKERAKAEALRNAAEQVAVLVQSLSVVQNGVLTKDEIEVISSGVMRLKEAPKFKIVPVSDEVIRYECQVTAEVDTGSINAKLWHDKQALQEAARQNRELTAEIARLNREMGELKEKYAAASTSERERISEEVKRNDEDFLAVRLNQQGAALCREGKYREAAQVFTEALAKSPRYAYAYHNRGIAYGKLKDYRLAVKDFSEAINLDDAYATAYGGRGFAYYGLKDYVNAARDFGRAISLDPSYAEAYYGRGNVYMSMGHYEEALRDYEKALSLNPNLTAAQKNRETILASR
ncbi:MAG: tetratricopeptide repeat protein [Selenomonadaceae bacterium]|nr:tetratricopeptide repeat protein [Selenomonadaceae bacterium]